jgi:uncharacterized protein
MLINIREVFSGAVPKLLIRENVPAKQLSQTASDHINGCLVEGFIENRSGIVRLQISCETDVNECCDRCLEPFVRRYTFKVESILIDDENADDDEYLIVDGRHLDLSNVVVDNFLAIHPAKILCKDDCLGLDFDTGENLNSARSS